MQRLRQPLTPDALCTSEVLFISFSTQTFLTSRHLFDLETALIQFINVILAVALSDGTPFPYALFPGLNRGTHKYEFYVVNPGTI